MKLAIVDANIFIDLIRLELLDFLFQCGFELYTSNMVLEELLEDQFERCVAYVHSGHLTSLEVTNAELEKIEKLNAPTKLSIQDVSVYFIAKENKLSVLTGDNLLRKFCLKNALEVRGILFLFDLFVEKSLISNELAIKKLEYLMSYNPRLPLGDCKERLDSWNNNY